MERTLADWPNLAKYRDANAALPPPSGAKQRVIFMEDSITEGWSDIDLGFFAAHSYVDRGNSGQTTPQMLVRFRQDVIALQPFVVVILAGTNDIALNTGPTTIETIEGNLKSMAELARAIGDSRGAFFRAPRVRLPLAPRTSACAENRSAQFMDGGLLRAG